MSPFGSGNPNARIMIVGESFTQTEALAGEPFLAQNGINLNNILFKAGIMRGDCYCTNVFNCTLPFKPTHALIQEHTDRLWNEIDLIRPTLIISLGDWPLRVLTGAESSLKWRGSLLPLKPERGIPTTRVLSTLSLQNVSYNQTDRYLITQDCKRAKNYLNKPESPPAWTFILRPSFPQVCEGLESLLNRLNRMELWIDFDLETRAGHIACAGISWSLTHALCIPFMCVDNYEGYWSLEEETHIIHLLYQLLTHKNVQVRGQNLLYDCQYTWRHWHFTPRVKQDTMISHHTCFAGLPNNLAFQASLYCKHYLYWKDDGKTWTKDIGEYQLWRYNCIDCIRTRECGEIELENLEKMALTDVDKFQQTLFWPVLRAMQLGVRIDLDERKRLSKHLKIQTLETENWFTNLLGHPFNPRSPKQMCALFYDDLQNKKIFTRATKKSPSRLTCNEEALKTIASREPLMQPLYQKISQYRTLGVLLSTFIDAPLDIDNRMRCSYNICGTETYRFSSSRNAFDTGTNLQNIPKNQKESSGLPSIKKLFIPDPGYTFFDCDLDRADLQVVAWEAEEEELQQALLKGVDMHLMNAAMIFGHDIDMDLLIEGTDTCEEYKSRWAKERQFAKAWVHGCVDNKHEVLTLNGWLPIEVASQQKTSILICGIDGSNAQFESILDWYSGESKTDLIHFEGQSIDQLVTFDHRMPYRTDTRTNYRVGIAGDLPLSASLPKSVIFNGTSCIKNPQLLAAFHAEGSINKGPSVRFHFHEQRKAERLERLLEAYSYIKAVKGKDIHYYLNKESSRDLISWGKTLDERCLQWSHEDAKLYLLEQVYWDGPRGKTKSQQMCSGNKIHAEYAHTLAHLHGFGSQLSTLNRETPRQTLFRFSLNNRKDWSLDSVKITRIPKDGRRVYCPVTSTGFWLTRRNGKISVTGNTDYGGSARTMAIAAGCTVRESERAQQTYFGKYKGIKRWHERVMHQLETRHSVQNILGYRRFYFEDPSTVFSDALAWIPQSTVGCVINRVWVNLYRTCPAIQVLLQVHDSLAGQFPSDSPHYYKQMILECGKIELPYPKPLTIPLGIKTSTKSWGDCE